jgi:hypothetical protein
MKMVNAVGFSRRAAILAVVVTGALGGAASAAVGQLTLDPTAQLSPGRLHVHLTGTVSCDPGDNLLLSGQVVQGNEASGSGYAQPACDGTLQPYTIDVSSGAFPGITSGVFKPGKASAQVSTSVCDQPTPFPVTCTTTYTDAIIRLKQ